MMTFPIAQQPPFQIDISHSELIAQTFANVTIGPFKSLIHHVIPYLAIWPSGAVEMRRNDPTQESMMPNDVRGSIFREIQFLSASCSLSLEPLIYTGLSHNFSHSGGLFSLTKPIVFIPHHYLFRQGRNPFTRETNEDHLQQDPWSFTDDELRFLIAREITQIKGNGIFRIAIKVVLFTLLYFAYSFPLPLPIGLAIGALGIGCYLLSERTFVAKSDMEALELLSRRFNDPIRAKHAALSALCKIKQGNLLRRESNLFCRFYITKMGTNLIDLTHPSIESRIEALNLLH